MTESALPETELDDLGPVDYLVLEFPADRQNFSGEMAEELSKLAESGSIRILDLLLLQKSDDGTLEALELDDLDELDELRRFETYVAEVLAAEDVDHLGAAIDPGTVAAVLVWENTWATPFVGAARRAGGQLVASGRIPIQAIAASIEAELAEEGD